MVENGNSFLEQMQDQWWGIKLMYWYLQIIKICLVYICHDPNYNYDDDDDDAMETEDDEEEE